MDAVKELGLTLEFMRNVISAELPPRQLPLTSSGRNEFLSWHHFCAHHTPDVTLRTGPVQWISRCILVMYTNTDTVTDKPSKLAPITTSEPGRLQLHFFHPIRRKLHTLLLHAVPARVSTSTWAALDRITAECKYRRLFSTPPSRSQASIPLDQRLFNYEVAVCFVWLESRPVLHVICTYTTFQRATVLRPKSVEDIWAALLEGLFSLYSDYPALLRVDHETTIASDVFHRWDCLTSL